MSAISVAARTAESVLIPTGHMRRFRMISYRPAIHNSPVCRRKRRMKSWRRIHQPRSAIPSAPAARRPAPATSVHKHPPAIPIRHPSPRIRGNPCISKAGHVAPVAITEWVPSQPHVVGLPYVAIVRDIIVLAVIIQVTRAVLIR
jgi:hypothetical protein